MYRITDGVSGVGKRGRPNAEIEISEFEKLCELQCTKEEICGWFGISDKTLDSWCKRTYKENFSVVFRQKRGKGKISLRRSQWRLAEKNANMAIWLGKQYLDQKDHIETTNGGEIEVKMRALADIIEKPAQNRKIEDFEE